MKTTKELKKQARMALSGNYALAILVFFTVNVISMIGSHLAAYLFPDTTPGAFLLQFVFLFIFSLITSIFTAGSLHIYLKLSRGEKSSLGELSYFLKNNPDRVIIVALVMTVIELILSMPGNIYAFTVPMGQTLYEQSQWFSRYLMAMLFAIVMQMLLTMPFTLAYYLLSDNPEMSGKEALKVSAKMMKGNYGRYIWMNLSFLPLILLSIFTLYIALIWILPYMNMTKAMFYRSIKGEFMVNEDTQA